MSYPGDDADVIEFPKGDARRGAPPSPSSPDAAPRGHPDSGAIAPAGSSANSTRMSA